MADSRLGWDGVERVRRAVLKEHPSGAKVDLERAVDYHRQLPHEERMADVLRIADNSRRTLVQARSGVPHHRRQRRLMETLRDQGDADVLSITVDSFTRQHRFDNADRVLAQENGAGHSELNGFPLISAGVDSCRQIVRRIGRPVEVRHGHPDARLLAEIALAGGCTGFEGGALTYCLPYHASYDVATSIANWQYIDRLCARYGELGATIHRESFGALTGLLVLPSMAISCGILELLLALEQGITSFSVGYAQLGSVVQDVAALRVLKMAAVSYALSFAAISDVEVSTVLYEWMGPFPSDVARANAIIALGGAVAGLAAPTRVITKSSEEAHGIPSADANTAGMRLTRASAALFGNLHLDRDRLTEEEYWIRREVDCILSSVLDRSDGPGTLAAAVASAVSDGLIDVPYSPHRGNAGQVTPLRDTEGMVRYENLGRVPFDSDVRERNDERLRGTGTRSGLESAILRAFSPGLHIAPGFGGDDA